MENAMEWLAKRLNELASPGKDPLIVGTLISPNPIMVRCDGLVHSGGSLLIDAAIADKLDEDPQWLKEGDKLVVLPIEERQRYVILSKVVEI